MGVVLRQALQHACMCSTYFCNAAAESESVGLRRRCQRRQHSLRIPFGKLARRNAGHPPGPSMARWLGTRRGLIDPTQSSAMYALQLAEQANHIRQGAQSIVRIGLDGEKPAPLGVISGMAQGSSPARAPRGKGRGDRDEELAVEAALVVPNGRHPQFAAETKGDSESIGACATTGDKVCMGRSSGKGEAIYD